MVSFPTIPGIDSKRKKGEKKKTSKLQSFEEVFHREWEETCQYVQDHGGTYGPWVADNIMRKLTVNAPVTLGFALICIVVHILTLNGQAMTITRMLAVHDRWDGLSLAQYTSFWTHCLVHNDYQHLKGNMTMLLLVGPSVEHNFKSRKVLWIMCIVSLVSALVHIVVGKSNTHQLGASGIVFSFILLNSLSSAKKGEIPVAFVITMILYMGDEMVKFVWPTDNISHHAHLTGGAVGAAAGFYIHEIRDAATPQQGQPKRVKKKD